MRALRTICIRCGKGIMTSLASLSLGDDAVRIRDKFLLSMYIFNPLSHVHTEKESRRPSIFCHSLGQFKKGLRQIRGRILCHDYFLTVRVNTAYLLILPCKTH